MTYGGYRNNEDEHLQEKGGIDLSGKNEMIFIRNRFQKKLDVAFSDIRKKVWEIELQREEIIRSKNYAEKLRKDIEKHKEEKDRSLSIIENLLKKELEYENGMLGKTLEGMKSQGDIIIKQKLKDVEIDNLQYGSIEQYKRLYPNFGDQVFKYKNEMETKDREIRIVEEKFNSEVSKFNSLLENVDVNIQKGEASFVQYEDILNEGKKELDSCRYNNSMLYRLSSKKTKTLLNLDTTIHDVRKFKMSLETISRTISQLTPM